MAITEGIRAHRITQSFPRPPHVISTGTSQIVAREVFPVIEFSVDRNLYRPIVSSNTLMLEFQIQAEKEAQETKLTELETMLESAQVAYDAESASQDAQRAKGEAIQPNQYDSLVRLKDQVESYTQSIAGAKASIADCEDRLARIVATKPVMPDVLPNMDFTVII